MKKLIRRVVVELIWDSGTSAIVYGYYIALTGYTAKRGHIQPVDNFLMTIVSVGFLVLILYSWMLHEDLDV